MMTRFHLIKDNFYFCYFVINKMSVIRRAISVQPIRHIVKDSIASDRGR